MTYNSKVIPIGYIFIECATLIFIESAYVHDRKHLRYVGVHLFERRSCRYL